MRKLFYFHSARGLFFGLAFGLCLLRPAGAAEVPALETNAHPGINKDYFAPNLDVGKFVQRFEKEGREIHDQRREIFAAVKVKPGTTVADIGAGTGMFTLPFAQAVGPKGKVYAVDIVKDFVNHVAERAKTAGLTNVQCVLCTERSVELPPNSIDLAFLCDVYHHFEYPKSSLASIRAALKPDGEFVVVDLKRIEGKSNKWTLEHVRAGQETVVAEIQAAGFKQIEEQDFLKENYFLRFRKVAP